MTHSIRPLAAALIVTTSLVGMASAAAAGPTAAKAHMVPTDTKVTIALKAGDLLKMTQTVDGIDLTADCTHFSAPGKTPANALTLPLTTPRKAADCSDTLAPSDQVTTNDTNGSWTYSLNSTGTRYTLGIPKDGGTWVSNGLPSCVVTFAAKGRTTVSGPVGGAAKGTVPISATGCSTSSTSAWSLTLTVTPSVTVEG